MVAPENRDKYLINSHHNAYPPGRIKIADALRALMEKKEFNAITTSEIAKTAGVTEALIYKYFKDKRDLLHEVLKEYLEPFVAQMKEEIKNISGAKNKLRGLISIHFDLYSANRAFARILVLEVRNYPGYFESSTYEVVKEYGKLISDIVEEGVKSGEIRDDVPPSFMRQFIIGGIEHFILPRIIFGLEIFEDVLTENLCRLIFRGIEQNELIYQSPQSVPSEKILES